MPWSLILAWLVHLYTALGVLVAFIAVLAIEQSDFRSAFFLMALAVALDATGLVQPHSRVEYEYRVRTAMDPQRWRERFVEAFPDDDSEVRTFADRSRRIAEVLDQVASGMLLIGFSALFIGGLGVFNSVHGYLQGKLGTIATLRALGLRDHALAAVYLFEIGVMAAVASAAGALFGGLLAAAGSMPVADRLPEDAGRRVVPGAGLSSLARPVNQAGRHRRRRRP